VKVVFEPVVKKVIYSCWEYPYCSISNICNIWGTVLFVYYHAKSICLQKLEFDRDLSYIKVYKVGENSGNLLKENIIRDNIPK